MEKQYQLDTHIAGVLEGSVKLHLVNPLFYKTASRQKSDVNDAEWIATCPE